MWLRTDTRAEGGALQSLSSVSHEIYLRNKIQEEKQRKG